MDEPFQQMLDQGVFTVENCPNLAAITIGYFAIGEYARDIPPARRDLSSLEGEPQKPIWEDVVLLGAKDDRLYLLFGDSPYILDHENPSKRFGKSSGRYSDDLGLSIELIYKRFAKEPLSK